MTDEQSNLERYKLRGDYDAAPGLVSDKFPVEPLSVGKKSRKSRRKGANKLKTSEYMEL